MSWNLEKWELLKEFNVEVSLEAATGRDSYNIGGCTWSHCRTSLFVLHFMFTINHFRLTALARRTPCIRSYSKKSPVIRPTSTQNQSAEQDNGDFRPPWVYSASHILTYTLIPSEFSHCRSLLMTMANLFKMISCNGLLRLPC